MKELLLVAGIHLLAVMSPGPDFAMVLRNSLVHSRRTGVLAAIGLALGILVHVTYSLLGIAVLISRSILLFNTIKLIGAAYLVYIGIKSLLAKPNQETKVESGLVAANQDLTTWKSIKMGFLTNILNPKATLFFLALFTQVIKPTTGLGMKMLYGGVMSLQTFLWFALVATLLTQKPVRLLYERFQHKLEKLFGAILVGLGLEIALVGRK